jgi:hypothetical protein
MAWASVAGRRGATILEAPHRARHGLRELVVEGLNGFRLAFGEFVPEVTEESY